MIQKLRIKVVAVSMSLVTVVLAVVFCAAYLSFQQDLEDLSSQVLHRVISQEGASSGPPEMEIGGDRVMLPYFTVSLWQNTAYVTGGTYSGLENTQTLQDILSQALAQDRPSGTVRAYHMRYLRQDNGLYEKLAFVDMSMELAILGRMMGSYLLIGAAALAVLAAMAVVLAFWVTRPVERAWRQQRQFLSDASHELKTPLTVILSNAELLQGAGLDGRGARWADNILSESRRMKTLVEEMLTLARSDNAAAAPVLGRVNLSDVATDCALAFEPVAFEAGKPLAYHIAPDLAVCGSAEHLRQLVSILLDNAIKYGGEGGTITLSLESREGKALLTVSNPGTPIPPEDLRRIFQRFYRGDTSRGEQAGFGLGLSIAQTIAREHRATLRAESDETSTRFLFSMALDKQG